MDKCWKLIGYPKWHPLSKKYPQKGKSSSGNGNTQGSGSYKNHKGKGKQVSQASTVQSESQSYDHGGGRIFFTQQQFEQLLRSFPSTSKSERHGSDTEEEIEANFSGMVSCCHVVAMKGEWILDSEATDHMTASFDLLDNPTYASHGPKINLPNGHTKTVSHVGDLTLENNLTLKDVMCVPSFKHNLMSVQKLTKDSTCYVTFYDRFCLIQDSQKQTLKGIGKVSLGLYYLLNVPLHTIDPRLDLEPVVINDAGITKSSHSCPATAADMSIFPNGLVVGNNASNVVSNSSIRHSTVVNNSMHKNYYSLWHNRMGHTPMSKLKYIHSIANELHDCSEKLCITCPMSKFTKQPFPVSFSHAKKCFELIHIDI